NLFVSVFPMIIFFFTMIPYIPIDNFQSELLKFLNDVLPEDAYNLFSSTIEDTVIIQRGRLLSIGFILMLFFSSNGIIALIHAFNATHHDIETRSWLNKRVIAILLVIILSILVTTAISLVTVSNRLAINVLNLDLLKSSTVFFIVGFLKWIIVIALFYFGTSFLYYLGPSRKSHFRFISPGATLATIIQIIATLGFSYYVNNFGQYNKLYGSIGTIIVVMMLLYITSFALILGFELNASIRETDMNKINKKKKSY
ncbi:MAG TPA: YihY/virulence factor BrkB family protein, partial [Bacteroidales bacterium]|nr:YihY/virulence factor BrkB family protein [Bacteroidales bacterium]